MKFSLYFTNIHAQQKMWKTPMDGVLIASVNGFINGPTTNIKSAKDFKMFPLHLYCWYSGSELAFGRYRENHAQNSFQT